MGPKTMLSRASLLLVLFLLVSAPLSAVAEEATTEPQGGDFEPSETTLSEQERLALAASHWQRMPEASMVATSWKPSTGLLHLAGGSFDPTMQDGPELPVDYQRTHDMAHTMHIPSHLHHRNNIATQTHTERAQFRHAPLQAYTRERYHNYTARPLQWPQRAKP